ncbi:VOC family protein [Gymnodinialimonas sp. 2305UL16-5]|uniref:VOC family protein n=1 Tax=Gymnodinialimonas mytili TaxID=3126503 RepID=UPI00309E8714
MSVERIDHVHIEVADRDRAADWYRRVLGLRRDPDLAVWADDPMGPLILQAGDGQPALSLFARGCAPPSRDTTIAFRMDGAAFAGFLARLPDLQLSKTDGPPVTPADVVDHGPSHSIYFADPDGNRLEVTTYDLDPKRPLQS